jgi:putative ABC transport system substrate-binding protein
MKRRQLLFLTAFSIAAASRPVRALAQAKPAKMPRIGIVAPGTPDADRPLLDEFKRGLHENGYVEGQTVDIEYLHADGRLDQFPALMAKVVQDNVDIILTWSTPGSLAAKRATSKIPIVFGASSDPLSTGVVATLARPGGNITGLSLMASDLSAKRLEIMQSLVPRVSRIAVLWDSSNPGMALRVRETKAAAEQAKIEFYDAGATDQEGLEVSFSQLARLKPDALLVTNEPFTNLYRDRILEFMAGHRIPAMYEEGRYPRAGGLMSYGPHVSDLLRRAAFYVDKILKGANPADLPVEQPTKFELVINLKAAKALGVDVPPSLLARADEVIE